VRFVDVGDDGVVACDQLKTLQPDLRKLPKMALPAQLYGELQINSKIDTLILKIPFQAFN